MGNVGTSYRYGAMLNLNVKRGKWNFTGMYNLNQAFNDTKGFIPTEPSLTTAAI